MWWLSFIECYTWNRVGFFCLFFVGAVFHVARLRPSCDPSGLVSHAAAAAAWCVYWCPQEVTLRQTSPGNFVVDLKAAAVYS
jgi:hypothetical protein